MSTVVATALTACDSGSSAEPAPTSPPPCPPKVTVGQVEPALGHRASVITVTNCRDSPYTVSGYPEISVLDGERKPLAVRVKHGTSYMASDPGPRELSLPPGGSARAVLSWSNTVTDGEVVNGEHVTVSLLPGRESTTLPLQTDLGTTGEVTVSAWSTEPPR